MASRQFHSIVIYMGRSRGIREKIAAVIVAISCVWTFSVAADAVSVRDFDGIKIYHVPFFTAVNIEKSELFPHYDALKRKNEWKYAYFDMGWTVVNPVYAEEIPANRPEVLGQNMLAEVVFLVAAGEGVAVHKGPDGSEDRVIVRKGDLFFVPYGHWVGFANPFDAPVRIFGCGANFVPALMNPDLPMKVMDDVPNVGVNEVGLRPATPFVLEYLKYQKQEPVSSLGDASSSRVSARKTPRVVKKTDFTVYQPEYATPINAVNVELPLHHFPKRAAEGRRDAHFELGGRTQNNLHIEHTPPALTEIGHKHLGGAHFYGLYGKGYMAFRANTDSPEKRVLWGPGDFFCIPSAKGGLWHAHANYTDETNRLIRIASEGIAEDMFDPYVGRAFRDYSPGQDNDAIWKAIKPSLQ